MVAVQHEPEGAFIVMLRNILDTVSLHGGSAQWFNEFIRIQPHLYITTTAVMN